MEDTVVNKESVTTLTGDRWRSCCRRCAKMKRKLDDCVDPQCLANRISKSVIVNKIVNDPCNPLDYVLGRQIDNKVDYCKKLIDARFSVAQNLFRKDLYSHFGCVNAIEFSKEGDMLVSGGDDKRVLLWNVEKAIQEQGKPVVMKAQHMSNIFCLGYNSSNTKIFSAGNDDQVIVHDLKTTDVLNFFRHEKPVYGLSVHPHNDNVFSSACDDGRVLIYDIRESANATETFFCIAQHKHPFHSVMFNPVDPVMLATANAKEGVSMWDVRKPLIPVLRYGAEGPAQSCMNVRFNKSGTTLLALRRRLPPVLYAVNSATHLCQFDHPGYYNSCTMKSCCFAGNDEEYILSGSDDFNLYMWKIPVDDTVKWIDSAHMILRGHRSIVNHVRYNQASCVLASSGVEKIIKLWSPFTLSHKCLGGLKRDDDKEEKQRRVYTHDEYIGLVLRSGSFMTHDYSHQSTDEDQRMMAFFDSLVQREIESWSSEDVPTPQSPSDPENNNGTDHNASDSEDSYASVGRIMRCYFDSSLSSSMSDRPLESSNRITRLIANRREQLMRLAALENNSQSKNNNTSTSMSSTPTTTTTLTNNVDSRTRTRLCRFALKPKFAKRKQVCRVSVITRNRRKQNANYDTDTEPDDQQTQETNGDKDKYQTVDGAQPSTSTGLISSRRLRFTTTLSTESRQRVSRSSSSSSEDIPKHNGTIDNKRRASKTDSDSSSKDLPKRKATTRNKSKISIRKSKRQKTEPIEVKNHKHNGDTITPVKNSRLAPSSDSGITSGVSTVEKNGTSTSRAESSDRERSIKNLEWFKKKVDVARRGYRKRVMVPSPSSSDSSDD